MEDLVRFRMLANQLTDAEFLRFLNRFIQMKGRQILLKWIFNSRENENIADLTSIISQIITSRDPNDDDASVPSKNYSLNQLPTALISETASYLKATEYITLSRSCRKIYVSCYSPCKIYHMPTCLFKVCTCHLDFHILLHPLSLLHH